VSWSRTLKVRQILRVQIEAGEEIALLFSDLRGFSSYAAKEGDRAAFRLTQIHEVLLRERINEYGIVVKTLGDGVMAAFETPTHAVQAAVAIQNVLRERNREATEPLHVGIGIACGTPVMTDIDFIGHSVNLAQRLSALAKGGQILVDSRVKRDSPLDMPLRYLPLGMRSLPGVGIEETFEVGWIAERARVSDGGDHVSLILTEQGTLVTTVARDAWREVREALEQLRRTSATEEGWLRALRQRAVAAIVLRLVKGSAESLRSLREQPVERTRLGYRRGRLVAKSPEGRLVLHGPSREDVERFLGAVEVVRKEHAEGS